MNRLYKNLLLLFVPILLFSNGCKSPCKVVIPEINYSREKWFGSNFSNSSSSITEWDRSEDYRGKKIFLDGIDNSVLKGCSECNDKIKNLNDYFNNAKSDLHWGQCKTLQLINNIGSADYVGYFKIASLSEAPFLAKFPGPLGTTSDAARFWFKIVNTKNNKIVFRYSSIGPVGSQNEFNANLRLLIRKIDEFN